MTESGTAPPDAREKHSGTPPRNVVETEHLWIPMPDGVRLAARLWLPEDAAKQPVPAILEYIPYRKGDMVRARDERNHPFFAANGYACLRVDMRGSGDSEGHMPDMYTPHELDDARHVIEWIAAQDWCSGSIGMFGTSWGGTASLQAAIDAPAALKAVIAVCATHDRYEDDIHHKGGLLLTDSIEWGATLPAILAAPPALATVGEDWRTLWQERLDKLTFPLEAWVREEERSSYWQWGSVGRRADRITCPILAIGGWSDRYSSSVMSLVEQRPDCVWGIVGPWGHHYPDVGHPGPAIGFQQEALGWWDHWLSGAKAPPPWPRLRLWLREFDPPADAIDRRNGRWIELPDRASARTEPLTLHTSGQSLSTKPSAHIGEATIPHDLRVGSASGDTGYFGRFGGLPTDQNADDRRSLTFETGPLTEELVLVGAAETELTIVSDRPLAQLALRIIDVAPDGQAARVALALRNLALDDSLETGAPLKPGIPQAVRIRFHNKAYRFAPGHRIRLSLSASYWPLAWPSPQTAQLKMRMDCSKLILPMLRTPIAELVKPFPPPAPQPKSHTQICDGELRRFAATEPDGSLVSGWHQEFTSIFFERVGVTFGYETRARCTIDPDDPLSAVSHFDYRMLIERADGPVEITGLAQVRCSEDTFLISGRCNVVWDGAEIFCREWKPLTQRRLS